MLRKHVLSTRFLHWICPMPSHKDDWSSVYLNEVLHPPYHKAGWFCLFWLPLALVESLAARGTGSQGSEGAPGCHHSPTPSAHSGHCVSPKAPFSELRCSPAPSPAPWDVLLPGTAGEDCFLHHSPPSVYPNHHDSWRIVTVKKRAQSLEAILTHQSTLENNKRIEHRK